jgi:hypothetical protein
MKVGNDLHCNKENCPLCLICDTLIGKMIPLSLLQTGAGKTYTMLGTADERGIMARTLNDLFLEMDKTREDMAYKVTVSFLEVRSL